MFRPITALAVLFGMATSEAHAASAAQPAAEPGETGRYIVRLTDAPVARFEGQRAKSGRWLLEPTTGTRGAEPGVDRENAAVVAYREFLADRRAAVLGAAAKAVRAMPQPEAVTEFASHTMVLELNADQVRALRAVEGVIAVVPDGKDRLHTDAGPTWIGADDVWSGLSNAMPNKGEGIVVGVIDQGINWDHPAFQDPAEDGYDFSNPFGRQLGSCSNPIVQCNDKLVGVHDFTDEGTQGKDTDGHGTHVASIAVGNERTAVIDGITVDLEREASGVAPRANLVSYKVCIADDPSTDQDEEGCVRSAILRALDQVVVDGVDVVNYSIGGEAQNPWAASNVIADAMLSVRAAGTLVVTSAGNDGFGGASTISNPANAPWMLTVANISHDRRFANAVEGLVGGNAAPPGDLDGVGLTAGFGPARIVHARDFGNALCGAGDPELQPACNQHTGSSNPFAPNTFNGEIVVCDRGTYGRVEKGFNVREAGAGGYILANTDAQGESIVGDDHCLPAVHLGDAAGDLLRAWLAAGGNDHSGLIAGQFAESLASLGDVVNGSSSRGPASFAEETLKPDIAAPGTDILGAGRLGDETLFLSGTSMASPHVAGAAALLLAERPDLTPDQVHSILVLSARNEGMRLPGSRADLPLEATAFDVGAGRARVDRAVGAGLYLPVTASDFQAANPARGGDPQALNLPGLVEDACLETCSFERRIRDLAGGGNWTADFEAPEGVTVTVRPREISLRDGQSVNLAITIDVTGSPALLGGQAEGAVRLVAGDGASADLRIPFSVFVDPGPIPERLPVSADGAHGSALVTIDGVVALPDAAFDAIGLAPQLLLERSIIQDSTNLDPYDNVFSGVAFATVDVEAPGATVFAETIPGNNGDLDLFVGLDVDGDGRPDAEEELCASTSPNAAERCVLDDAEPGRYWVLVQNWQASFPSASDTVRVRYAALEFESESFVVTGPGATAKDQAFDVRVIWDEGRMERGETWLGLLTPKAVKAPGQGELGAIPVLITRNDAPGNGAPGNPDDSVLPAYALRPGTPARLAIGSRERHGRLFFDLPEGVGSATIDVASDENVDVEIIRSDYAFAAPDVPLAEGTTVASAVRPGGVESLTLDEPAAGRYYVVLTNDGATGALVAEVLVTVDHAGDRVRPVPGLYFNPARSGHGINLNTTDDQLVIEWYTYLEDGTPTWYLAQGPLPEVGSQWHADLGYFSWNGDEALPTDVGDVILTFLSPTEFVFTFRVNGASGTEPFQAIAPEPGCDSQGDAASRTGLWFMIGRAGFGYSILGLSDTQVQINYLYDGIGVPRWVLGQGEPTQSGPLPLAQFAGFCPTCNFVETSSVTVGLNDYALPGSEAGSMTTDLAFEAPLAGAWLESGAIRNLTPSFRCN